jgi:hypothetical protein
MRSQLVAIAVMLLVSMAACHQADRRREAALLPVSTPMPQPPECERIFHCSKREIEACEQRADVGDADAMRYLGEMYLHIYAACSENADGGYGISLLRKAADAGNGEGLEELYMERKTGRNIPKDEHLAQGYLQEGVAKGYGWAMAADIGRKDQGNDPAAFDDLLKSAVGGNCHSQQSLAKLYMTGRMDGNWQDQPKRYAARRHLTKAYFWALVSGSTGGTVPGKDYYELSGILSKPCPVTISGLSYEIERLLAPDLAAVAQAAAKVWKMGAPEPDLPAPKAAPGR